MTGIIHTERKMRSYPWGGYALSPVMARNAGPDPIGIECVFTLGATVRHTDVTARIRLDFDEAQELAYRLLRWVKGGDEQQSLPF